MKQTSETTCNAEKEQAAENSTTKHFKTEKRVLQMRWRITQSECKSKDAEYHYCKKGHITSVCCNEVQQKKMKQAHQLTEDSSAENADMYMLLRTSGSKSKPIEVRMQVHNKELQMKVDPSG